MRRRAIVGLGIAAIVVTLSLLNASWVAPAPPGRLTVIAQRGIVQPAREGADPFGCPAAQIRPDAQNRFIENSLASLYKATRIGADMVEVDVRLTRDGHPVLFRDETLDCRTDGKGPVAEKTLAELKSLDIGYGYTSDGREFPLRGRGIGGLPTVEEALRELRGVPFLFRLHGSDPALADAVLAAFAATGRKLDSNHGFHGNPAVIARVKQLAPEAWIFDARRLDACAEAYAPLGWTGSVPEECRGTTVGVPAGGSWTLWGWPYRFLARMRDAGSRVLMYGSVEGADIKGIDRVERYDEVPRGFTGFLLVDDFGTVGASLRR